MFPVSKRRSVVTENAAPPGVGNRYRGKPHYRLRIARSYHVLTLDGRKAALHELPPQPPAPRDKGFAVAARLN
jgi:hypothetical protein